MTINIAALDEVMAHIEANPADWEQREYRCSTGMCVAGWRAQLSGGRWATGPRNQRAIEFESADCGVMADSYYARECLVAEEGDVVVADFDGLKVTPAHERARLLLGLDEDQALALFSASNSLADLRFIVADLKAQAESEAS